MSKNTSWTFISAFDRVLELSKDSKLSKSFWKRCAGPLNYLTKELGLTKMQVVFVAVLIEKGMPMSWRDFADFYGCSRISVMVYSDDIEALKSMRWVVGCVRRDYGATCEGFRLAKGVVTALRHNQPFTPESIAGLSLQQFMDMMDRRLNIEIEAETYFGNIEEWLLQLCNANSHLPLCNEILNMQCDVHSKSLLLLAVSDYGSNADTPGEGLSYNFIDRMYEEIYKTDEMLCRLRDGEHILFKMGLMEHKCEDGIADHDRYVITSYCKDTLLAGYTPNRSRNRRASKVELGLTDCATIKEKSMFYNSDEQAQIEKLARLLSQENLQSVQERLAQEGMRRGLACLFYGAPGTGKTETVLQIARQTGRCIMRVDIAGMRDKFVGESEKNIRDVFRRYRDACKNNEVTPILLFNEADGILGKRTTISGDSNSSVEKMDNAMQNIILQELEDLDGILIATTNLTCNLDSAFERRFLFKVEFRKPDTEVKSKLWGSMLRDKITSDDARDLAGRYDFSGGQIENIARKCTIDSILSGKNPSVEEIEALCKVELIGDNNSGRRPIGFCA